MEMGFHNYTVRELLELYKNKMLTANAEYQRGSVWSLAQKKKLVDSVLRGYPIPLIYLHHIKKSVAGMQREDLEIIDEQQRITALHEFSEGAFKLFDPNADSKEAKFPDYIKRQLCPWGRKDFPSLSTDLQDKFLDTPLATVRIETDNENETRDLFIRLQAGLPLNSQETRDAWPGNFTDFVLRLGGKPQLARYQGHGFFRKVLGMNPESDRGKTRQLAAQIAMLFLTRRASNNEVFIDINSKSIDDFYYTHIDFDVSSPDAKRLVAILDKLEALFGSGRRPRMRGHAAIHLVLLTDTLWDDYTRGWEDKLADAHDQFSANLVKAKQTKDALHPDEFWTQYGQWTRVNSDMADRIQHRHIFYVEKMLEYLAPLQLKDSKRSYGSLEREQIYFRDQKKCAVCGSTVAWLDADIHHVHEHAKGGPTVTQNGVLVHRACHPKGSRATAFAEERETKTH